MQDDKSAQDAKRLLEAFSINHDEASTISPHGAHRPFIPNWADAEQAGLDRVRRDEAMGWLVNKGMLERDEESENLLVTGEGFPDYGFGSVFRITDSGRELLEEIWQESGHQ